MKTLLRIDASARLRDSHSRLLADRFEQRWLSAHPGGRIARRDLSRVLLPHLDAAAIQAFLDPSAHTGSDGGTLALSDTLVNELHAADDVVIASPLYNMGAPSPLKAWVDHVTRIGLTFAFTERGPRGLLSGKRAWLLVARGLPSAGADCDGGDFLTPHLRAALTFLGLDVSGVVILAGTADAATVAGATARAHAAVDRLFAGKPPAGADSDQGVCGSRR